MSNINEGAQAIIDRLRKKSPGYQLELDPTICEHCLLEFIDEELGYKQDDHDEEDNELGTHRYHGFWDGYTSKIKVFVKCFRLDGGAHEGECYALSVNCDDYEDFETILATFPVVLPN